MADTHDPTDHFRTTHQHAGEYFIDLYCWPGLWSIALGTVSLICCIAAIAYRRHEWILSTGIAGVLAVAGGATWLLVEHHRVLRIEQRWRTEHPDRQARTKRPTRPA